MPPPAGCPKFCTANGCVSDVPPPSWDAARGCYRGKSAILRLLFVWAFFSTVNLDEQSVTVFGSHRAQSPDATWLDLAGVNPIITIFGTRILSEFGVSECFGMMVFHGYNQEGGLESEGTIYVEIQHQDQWPQAVIACKGRWNLAEE